MSRLIPLLFLPFAFFACRNNNKVNPVANTIVKDTTTAFQYKDISEDGYIDHLKPGDIKDLFGSWTITSIAKAGGTIETEEQIRSQVGRRLRFDDSLLVFDFLNDSLKINHPVYSIEDLDTENVGATKGTTWSSGYRPCRKSVIMLVISERLSLEVIQFREMAYYYDGRIYFLARTKP